MRAPMLALAVLAWGCESTGFDKDGKAGAAGEDDDGTADDGGSSGDGGSGDGGSGDGGSGDGGVEDLAGPPHAVIEAVTEAVVPTTVDLDGSGSYVEWGEETLDYAWAVRSAPEGVDVSVSREAASGAELGALAVGSYEVELTVTNVDGEVSEPEIHEFDALPHEDLHVELTWEGDVDLDLHFVDEGYTIFDEYGDACWCNVNPDWGAEGDGTDDPELLLDALMDGGAEALAMEVPYGSAYEVMVHFFNDLGGTQGVATIRLWFEGEIIAEEQATLSNDDVWIVGVLEGDSGVFLPDGSLTSTALSECIGGIETR